MAHPELVLSAPVVQPSDAVIADLELALEGVRLPVYALGGRAGCPPPDGMVRVAVTEAVAKQTRSAGGVVLADREGTPLALLEDADVTTEEDVQLVTGRLLALRAPEVGAYRASRRPPAAVAAAGPRRVVVALRPPIAADAEALGTPPDGDLLVLVPVAGATLDGLPADVLVPAVRAALGAAPDAALVPVPFAPRDPATDAAIATALAGSYGATDFTVLDPAEPAWREALAVLRDGILEPSGVLPEVRSELLRWRPPRARRGIVVLFTGLSGSGKSTVARALVEHVRESTRRTVSLLDGDDVRRMLSSGLGFDRAARDLNVRRIGFVGAEAARHGGMAVCAPIAPYDRSRAAVRAMVETVGDFVLVHVSTPLEECERRDLKGLYAKARAGLVADFTGVSDPYEAPQDADVTVDTSDLTEDEALARVLHHLYAGGWLQPRDLAVPDDRRT